MAEPRTLLESLIRQQQLTWEEAARKVRDAAYDLEKRSISLTGRHLGRLARREGGAVNPNPSTCRALQAAFGKPVEDLLAPHTHGGLVVVTSGRTYSSASDTTEREVLAVAADRAQQFAIHLPGMPDLTMEQVAEGVRDLALAYPARPLSEILGHLVSVQDTVFGLLERPQRPSHGRQLYFLAGIVGGMLAKSHHDLGDPTGALTQARTAYLCAEQADHHGLRAWISGLQSLVAYWANRPHDAVHYAQRGEEFATRARNTTTVWLPASEARAWAKLGNADQARAAILRAEDAWSSVQPDELDELGGLATFSRPRQLYYAADALVELPDQAEAAEDYAQQAVTAYTDRLSPDWAFGDASGSAADLARARLARGEVDGAVEALDAVLRLPAEQRINGIVASLNSVHQDLARAETGDVGKELQERIEAFTRTPVRALPR